MYIFSFITWSSNFISYLKRIRLIVFYETNELIAEATYDQRSHGVVHVRHLYESHLPVLWEELEGFHGETILGKSVLDLFLSYRSPECSKLNVVKSKKNVASVRIPYFIVAGLLTECLINAGLRSADRCFDNFSNRVS